jgi:hypothetical protein
MVLGVVSWREAIIDFQQIEGRAALTVATVSTTRVERPDPALLEESDAFKARKVRIKASLVALIGCKRRVAVVERLARVMPTEQETSLPIAQLTREEAMIDISLKIAFNHAIKELGKQLESAEVCIVATNAIGKAWEIYPKPYPER